jgi:hypothetical protein
MEKKWLDGYNRQFRFALRLRFFSFGTELDAYAGIAFGSHFDQLRYDGFEIGMEL